MSDKNRDLLISKLKEVTALAEIYNMNAEACVLNCLTGAIYSGNSDGLADECVRFSASEIERLKDLKKQLEQ